MIGAQGRIGKLVVEKLLKTDLVPIAGVHHQVEEADTAAVESRVIDVQGTVTAIQQQLSGVDAIVFTAGGGMLIDLDGKVKVAQAAEKAGVSRFVLVSAGGIQHFHDDQRLAWMDEFEEYSASMYYSDMFILNSRLDYTIIRPEHLIDTPGNGLVRLGEYLPHHNVSRANVAELVVASLLDPRTIGQAFDVEDGQTPIADALATLERTSK
ncbi:NAD(P)-binding oxidoreductase [Levilactobacillus namurensis]|uniref:NAD(P)-binding oxidoreductase n=1 Tax=Levilactobacillus namurensis TaxID=380393 RepID=UPI001D736842|nr:NAD(P)-binding oxidoreductase [Levilactobacillus namurensis]HJE45777.1 SDR family oxidoreductase [Levilactobacillus namurensis]